MRMAVLPVVGASLLFLPGCSDSSPTEAAPDAVDVAFVYQSSVVKGDSVEAGFCAHHMLGSSWVQLWQDGVSVNAFQMRSSESDPKLWQGRGTGLPVGEPLVAVIQDLECCSRDDVCAPTELLMVNGVPLHEVVEVSDAAGSRPGLAFRVGSRGTVHQ